MPKEQPSFKEYVILTLLHEHGKMYGRQMIDESGGQLKIGTVYNTLHRMEDKCWVTSEEEPPDARKSHIPRRIYELTAQGQEARKSYQPEAFSIKLFLESHGF